jgi:ATP-dependent RNA helicase DDX42
LLEAQAQKRKSDLNQTRPENREPISSTPNLHFPVQHQAPKAQTKPQALDLKKLENLNQIINMSKRKFGFEGFGINRQPTYNFERSQPPQRLYVPPSSRSHHDNYEDTDLDNIDYDEKDSSKDLYNPNDTNDDNNSDADDDENDNNNNKNDNGNDEDEIDPLDAFMEGIQEEMRSAPPPKPKEKAERYRDDEEDDPMESFLKAKKDLGLTLASEALRAGYDSDEEVYAAAKAIDAGMLEYDSDDNPIVVDKKKIEPILPLDHSEIDYEPFNKDFYEENESISGK